MLGIKKSSGEIKNEIAIKYSVKYYDNLATDGNRERQLTSLANCHRVVEI